MCRVEPRSECAFLSFDKSARVGSNARMKTGVEAVDVVVGAGSGMGAAVAAALGGTRRLVLADRDREAVDKTAASLERDVQCVSCNR
jgi:NADP-dependent 3-hydroxy acid dehydrogenase YdfG